MSVQTSLSVIPIKLGYVKSFLIKGDKAVIVDTGYPGNGERILDSLRENLINPSDISLIMITHGHIDHYGSADELRKLTGAPVAMHRADAEYIKKGIHYIGIPTCLPARIFKSLFIKKDPILSKSLEVDIAFETDIDLKEFGINGSIIHTPGHTAGSVSVILSGGKAIIGDLMMGGILRKRTPHLPLFAHDLSQLQESIRKILALSPKIIHASHGGPFTKQAVEKFSEKIRRA
jgi:glyoxylase-like metal-dependent hydrolase (beta-lactamase superfamily II)